jgi:formate dehydrogenase subunit gamma
MQTEAREVVRFRQSTRWLHWTIAASWLALAITGIFFWVPGLGGAAVGGWSRLAHRVAAVVFMGAPLLYALFNWRLTIHFVKESLTWGKEDMGWLQAAPEYYFGGDESKMPPQDHINTGQKLYQLVTIGTGALFIASGILMWLFKSLLPVGVFQWAVVAHNVAFIAGASMFLVHVYLSAIHPRMTESLKSMLTGKASVEYLKSHHGRWYERVTANGRAGKAGAGVRPERKQPAA